MNKNYAIVFSVLILVLSLSITTAASGSYSGQFKVSSGGGKIVIRTPGMPEHYCGNGIYESYASEQCDGSDLPFTQCSSYLGTGYSGTLSCKSGCILDTSQCSNPTNSPNGDTGGNTGGNTGNGGGGGGGSTTSPSTTTSASSSSSGNCIENWECTNWTNDNLCGTRKCTDKNKCGTETLKPVEESDCDYFKEQGYEFEKGFLSRITGAVTGTLGTTGTAGVIVFILAIAGISTYVYKKRKNKK